MHELFLAIICANNIGSLVNNLFGVKIFNPFPSFSIFQKFVFTLSAIVSSGSNVTYSSRSSGGIGDKSFEYNSIDKFSDTF